MTVAKIITSLTNDRVKAIRALEMRKVRKETGLFVAEGASLLITARDHGYVPETLIYQAGTNDAGIVRGLIAWAFKEGAEVLEVSEAVLSKLASKDNPQTVLGVFKQAFTAPPDAKTVSKSATWLALEQVRDPGNLGTILRTSDATGVAGVILIDQCCDAYSIECIRATMGSIFAVPLVKMERPAFLALAAAWPGDVIATHLEATDDFRAVIYRGPELVVMGSEGPGLSAEVVSSCTRRVKIPMSGALDSLNLAIATALTIYQVRGRHLKM
ncbi:MAG: RNA methyltransferase [Hyphomicrobium sp.]|nr:RNA methyltransferase [Hyphomicrobium sp.]